VEAPEAAVPAAICNSKILITEETTKAGLRYGDTVQPMHLLISSAG
jgi:hypothetical protein